jgi:DNA-binding CsgD family transcriptional regulator/tetratricopeptide (TPR) repeat protein
LIGRREELAAVEQALTSVGSRAVVLAGAPGVGKTRLAMEALGLLEARGFVVRWAAATQAASSIPFGAVAHLLPRLGETAPDRADLLRRSVDGLVAAAGDRGLVVGIDDAHLLDDSSAALVHQLATATPVNVLVTVRSGTSSPDPIVALWKDTVADRFEIQALSDAEVAQLVGEALGGQVDGRTVRTLWRLTQGNPLYLRELILGGLDSGNLTRAGGVWRWDGAMVTSPRLVELIEARFGRLDPGVLELLELLALGEPIGVQLVERLADPQVLAVADRKGLLMTDEAGRRVQVRLAHPLYTEVIRAQVSPLRARAVYRQLAEAVEAAGARRRDDTLRVATWRLEAGQSGSSAPGQMTSAARLAMAVFDFRLAERLARAAAAAGSEVEAERVVGLALLGQGRPEDAELILASLTPSAGTDQQRLQVAITRAFNLYWILDLPARAKAVLQHVEPVLTDPGSRAELAAVLSSLLLYGGGINQALRALEPVLADPDAAPRSTLQALVVATPALFHAGRSEQAIEAAQRAFELEDQIGEEIIPWSHLQVAWNLDNAYLAAGRTEDAETLAKTCYQQALGQSSWRIEQALWAGWLGQIARARGQVRTAMRWLREAATLTDNDARLPFMPQVLGELAHAAALAGDLDAAQAALEAAKRYTADAARLFHLWVALARPWEAVARGERSTAVALAMELAEQARSRGQVTFQLQALHDVARLGEPSRVSRWLHEASAGVEGQLAPLYVAHADALSSHDAMALDRVASGFAGLGLNLLAAEAGAEAAGHHQAAGRRTAAIAATIKADALTAQCEGARTPALDARQAHDLTPRELEIATMAARGLSSKEIAGRLIVSVRTVDNTLRQVYAKLAVNKRADLRLLLAPERDATPAPSK